MKPIALMLVAAIITALTSLLSSSQAGGAKLNFDGRPGTFAAQSGEVAAVTRISGAKSGKRRLSQRQTWLQTCRCWQ